MDHVQEQMDSKGRETVVFLKVYMYDYEKEGSLREVTNLQKQAIIASHYRIYNFHALGNGINLDK